MYQGASQPFGESPKIMWLHMAKTPEFGMGASGEEPETKIAGREAWDEEVSWLMLVSSWL
jgi:hypothetical protein